MGQIVLGINENHNASAALLRDGEVLACASEERFSGLKNDETFPRRAIDYILDATEISPSHIDHIVHSTLMNDPIGMKIKRVTRYKITDYIREMHQYWKPVLLENRSSSYWDDLQKDPRFNSSEGVYYNFSFLKSIPREQWGEAFQHERRVFTAKYLRVSPEKIHFVDHHLAHANYAYFAAPLDRSQKTVVVTADSWGDGCNATISLAQGNNIQEIHRTTMCHLARIYRWITLLLGMKPNEHEYKVMGLAPYAQDYIKEPAYNIFKEVLAVDGLDFKWIKEPRDLYFTFRERFELEGVRFDGIAAGLQQWVEDLLVQWIVNILEQTRADRLVFSGGLAMNVKANKAIAEIPQVKDFFVACSPGDESLCIGGAYLVSNNGSYIPPCHNPYLGEEPSPGDVLKALQEYQAYERFQVVNQPTAEDLAEYLVQGKVLGRCVGPMEFGARALGNRSILCDPSKHENLRKINDKIKIRDFWMPFSPTLLSERAHDYVVNPKGLKAPFMTMAFESTDLARKHLIAALHPADFTVRPQVLEKEANPDYYAIIKAFEKKTGIGGVLNTSFNLHGKPIVRIAADALYTFVNSGLDGLVLPEVLVLKK